MLTMSWKGPTKRLLRCVVGLLSGTLMAFTGAAHAVAAPANPAGAEVLNTAQVSFSLAGGDRAVSSNTTTTRLDEVLDVVVVALQNSTSSVAAGATDQALAYKITNTGNGQETFELSATPATAGFVPAIKRIVIDSDGDGVLNPLTDTTYTGGATSPVLGAGQSVTVWVVCDIPADAIGVGAVKLTANTAIGHGSVGTVFAGKGVGGVDAIVGQTGALAATQASVRVGAVAPIRIPDVAGVTLVKSQSVADELGGSRALPGATITYSLDARFNVTGVLSGAHLTDGVPAGTTYVAGSLRLDGASVSDAAGFSASGLDVALGDVSGPAEHILTFQVRINPNGSSS